MTLLWSAIVRVACGCSVMEDPDPCRAYYIMIEKIYHTSEQAKGVHTRLSLY